MIESKLDSPEFAFLTVTVKFIIPREKGSKEDVEDGLQLFMVDKQYALNLQNSSESLESERKSDRDATRHCSTNGTDNVVRIQYGKSI